MAGWRLFGLAVGFYFRGSCSNFYGAMPPLGLTPEQDHQRIMDEMGIKAVRPGFSGDESALIMRTMIQPRQPFPVA
jgi:hypothetical protein